MVYSYPPCHLTVTMVDVIVTLCRVHKPQLLETVVYHLCVCSTLTGNDQKCHVCQPCRVWRSNVFCIAYHCTLAREWAPQFLSYKVVISVWLSFWALCKCWLEVEEDLPFVFGSLWSFFHFILLFWNQILIWRSERQRVWAISMRRRLVRYLLKWNSFSSSKTCCLV